MHLSGTRPHSLDLSSLFRQAGLSFTTSKEMLFHCVREGDAQMLQHLLSVEPALARQADRWLRGPLHVAAAYGARKDIIHVLLDSGADLLQEDLDGRTALHVCVDSARLLLTRTGVQTEERAMLALCLSVACTSGIPDDIIELVRTRAPEAMLEECATTGTCLIPEAEPYALLLLFVVPKPVSQEAAPRDPAPLPKALAPAKKDTCVVM